MSSRPDSLPGANNVSEVSLNKDLPMPRPRERVCLQEGLKLDLNWLIRRGTVRPGTRSGPYLIQWTNNYTGEVVRLGEITSGFCSQEEGWFRFEADAVDQRIILTDRPSSPLRWGAVVLHLPRHEPASIGALDASWCRTILQPSNLGKAGGRLSIAIPWARRSRARGPRKDQVAPDRRLRSR
jgi:hypothetical protein